MLFVNSHQCEHPTLPKEYVGRSSGCVYLCHRKLVLFLKDKDVCCVVHGSMCICVNACQTHNIPLSCPTRLAFRAFLPLATSLSVTVVHRFILQGAQHWQRRLNMCIILLYNWQWNMLCFMSSVCVCVWPCPGVITDQAFWDQCIMSSMWCLSVTK